jgi:hypothetical protein
LYNFWFIVGEKCRCHDRFKSPLNAPKGDFSLGLFLVKYNFEQLILQKY